MLLGWYYYSLLLKVMDNWDITIIVTIGSQLTYSNMLELLDVKQGWRAWRAKIPTIPGWVMAGTRSEEVINYDITLWLFNVAIENGHL